MKKNIYFSCEQWLDNTAHTTVLFVTCYETIYKRNSVSTYNEMYSIVKITVSTLSRQVLRLQRGRSDTTKCRKTRDSTTLHFA